MLPRNYYKQLLREKRRDAVNSDQQKSTNRSPFSGLNYVIVSSNWPTFLAAYIRKKFKFQPIEKKQLQWRNETFFRSEIAYICLNKLI